MKLTFLGTRGYIDPKNRRHRMHSSLLVSYNGKSVLVDCGEDWLGKLADIRPKAVAVTHSHPDHAGGLKHGAPCPVYASRQSWENMEEFDIADRRTIRARSPVQIFGIVFEAFPVEHSTRAPAVGFRITAGKNAVFYVPDVVHIHDQDQALDGVKVYVGDGSGISHSLVRKSGDALVGHTPVRTQLTWCQKAGVPRAIFTHCGSGIVKGDERSLAKKIRNMAIERGLTAKIAFDGMEVILR